MELLMELANKESGPPQYVEVPISNYPLEE